MITESRRLTASARMPVGISNATTVNSSTAPATSNWNGVRPTSRTTYRAYIPNVIHMKKPKVTARTRYTCSEGIARPGSSVGCRWNHEGFEEVCDKDVPRNGPGAREWPGG